MTRTRFALLAATVLLACATGPSGKQRRGAEVHYDLGVEALRGGRAQEALREFDEALKLNDRLADAYLGRGLVYEFGFGKTAEAERDYRRALQLRPAYPEAHVGLGNVYLDQLRYDEAIAQYEMALNDMLYRTPYFAQSNMGWALYKKGETQKGLDSVRAAVTAAPTFCQGWRTLGEIYEGTGQLERSCDAFAQFAESCPTVAEAHQRLGRCRAKLGRTELARESFSVCVEKSTPGLLRDDCVSFLAKLGGPPKPPPAPKR